MIIYSIEKKSLIIKIHGLSLISAKIELENYLIKKVYYLKSTLLVDFLFMVKLRKNARYFIH